jgi:4'-phosphopantetheinyl transferase
VTTVYLLLHDLDADSTSDEELDSLLDDAERGRAERFLKPVHRRRYRVGRALLRRTLSAWTGQPPPSIVFKYGRNGKPSLAGGPSFNVSHSEATLLIGLAHQGRIGVDVEVLRPVDDRLALAASHFAQDELLELGLVPPAAQDEAFLRIWTCKEALIKAVGDGLSIPLQSFSVSPKHGTNALRAMDATVFGPTGMHEWSISAAEIAGARKAVVAAVAVDSHHCDLTWLPRS